MNVSSNQHALIVEGGAMRSIFASGVLDAFLEKKYQPFDFAIGVSAGATTLMGFLSGQAKRSQRIILDHSRRREFINFFRFSHGGHLTDIEWLWNCSQHDWPLDMIQYQKNAIPLWVTTTNIETGLAEYTQVDSENVKESMIATCALPIAYKDYPLLNGIQMSDGGIADSIPVLEAYRRGAKKITVILSQPLGYRKKDSSLHWPIQSSLHGHQVLANAMLHRAEYYNKTLDFLSHPPSDCDITIIAPTEQFTVGRLTRNRRKLEQGYLMGKKIGYDLLSISNTPSNSEYFPSQITAVA